MKESDPRFPNGWGEHQKEQILFVSKNSTPTDRYKWLLNALKLLRKINENHLEKLK